MDDSCLMCLFRIKKKQFNYPNYIITDREDGIIQYCLICNQELYHKLVYCKICQYTLGHVNCVKKWLEDGAKKCPKCKE